MRDLTSIEAMIPDLSNKLAFMYYTTVQRSKHELNVNKDNYRIAEVHLNTINILLLCSPDAKEVNYHLNELQEYLRTCCLPNICSPDVIELQCQADDTPPLFWVPDEMSCTVPTSYAVNATINTITVLDLVDYLQNDSSEQVLNLVGEVGEDRQQFEIDTNFPKTLSAIYYFSNELNQYILTNKLSDYTITTPEGYTLYTYNGLLRGSITIKLIFV